MPVCLHVEVRDQLLRAGSSLLPPYVSPRNQSQATGPGSRAQGVISTTFIWGFLLGSVIDYIVQIILGIRSSEVFTVHLAFSSLSYIGTIFSQIMRNTPVFFLEEYIVSFLQAQ